MSPSNVDPAFIVAELSTHLTSIRKALEIAAQHAVVSAPDVDDRAYWRHEISALESIEKLVDQFHGKGDGGGIYHYQFRLDDTVKDIYCPSISKEYALTKIMCNSVVIMSLVTTIPDPEDDEDFQRNTEKHFVFMGKVAKLPDDAELSITHAYMRGKPLYVPG